MVGNDLHAEAGLLYRAAESSGGDTLLLADAALEAAGQHVVRSRTALHRIDRDLDRSGYAIAEAVAAQALSLYAQALVVVAELDLRRTSRQAPRASTSGAVKPGDLEPRRSA